MLSQPLNDQYNSHTSKDETRSKFRDITESTKALSFFSNTVKCGLIYGSPKAYMDKLIAPEEEKDRNAVSSKVIPEEYSDPTTQDSDSKLDISTSPRNIFRLPGTRHRRKNSKRKLVRAFPLTRTMNKDVKVDFGQKISTQLSPKQLFELLIDNDAELPSAF